MYVWTTEQQSFVDAPSNATVVEGQTVILHCSVANRKGLVQWTHDTLALGQLIFHVADSEYRSTVVDLYT